MKLLLTVLCLSGGLMLANGQDYGTVNFNLITSLVNVSNSQFFRAIDYINEYNEANRQLIQVSNHLTINLQGDLITTSIQAFLTTIQDSLNSNVQKLIVTYSPGNVRSFIVNYYQTFLTNLSLNNGTQSEISEMNQLYYSKFINPNATTCIAKYNSNHLQIYSNASLNFTQEMEKTIEKTVGELEVLRTEIKEMIAGLVTSLEDIIKNPASALQLFDSFISTRSVQALSQIGTWLSDFSTLMKQTQTNVRSGFTQFDGKRVNQTLAIVKETVECLKVA